VWMAFDAMGLFDVLEFLGNELLVLGLLEVYRKEWVEPFYVLNGSQTTVLFCSVPSSIGVTW